MKKFLISMSLMVVALNTAGFSSESRDAQNALKLAAKYGEYALDTAGEDWYQMENVACEREQATDHYRCTQDVIDTYQPAEIKGADAKTLMEILSRAGFQRETTKDGSLVITGGLNCTSVGGKNGSCSDIK
jgi:hypothetical protein